MVRGGKLRGNLDSFHRQPAITQLGWLFTSTSKSSHSFATETGSLRGSCLRVARLGFGAASLSSFCLVILARSWCKRYKG